MNLTTTSPMKLSEIRKMLKFERRKSTEKRARAIKWMLQHPQIWEGHPFGSDDKRLVERCLQMRRGLVKDGIWNKNTGVSNDYFYGLVNDARLVRRIMFVGGLKAHIESQKKYREAV